MHLHNAIDTELYDSHDYWHFMEKSNKMIIFDLDNVLANIEHRLHFINDPIDECNPCYDALKVGGCDPDYQCGYCMRYPAKWKFDMESYNNECVLDEPILPVIFSCRHFHNTKNEVQIWTGRCESMREKTDEWLEEYSVYHDVLKMRPVGDNTPLHKLKEQWYDLHNVHNPRDNIEMVFDADPKSIEMWKRRGIFVFDCNQRINNE